MFLSKGPKGELYVLPYSTFLIYEGKAFASSHLLHLEGKTRILTINLPLQSINFVEHTNV